MMTARQQGDATRPPGQPPAWLVAISAVAWRLLIVVAALAVTLWLLAQVAMPVLAFLGALLLLTLLGPVVRVLRRHGLPAVAAAALTLVVAVAALVGLFVALVVPVVNQFDTLAADIEAGTEALDAFVSGLPGAGDVSFDQLSDEAVAWMNENMEAIGTQVVSGALMAVEVVAALLLLLVTAFFLLKDGDRISEWLLQQFPSGARGDVRAVAGAAWSTLSSYVRGQIVVAAADAIGIGIGLLIIGVPLVLPLAALTFFAAAIPIVGATIAGAAVVLVALVDGGLGQALLALAIVVGVQQLESNLLAPVVLGRALPLHPLAILYAITAGVVVAGIIGALISVPLAATITAAISELRDRRSRSPERPATTAFPGDRLRTPDTAP